MPIFQGFVSIFGLPEESGKKETCKTETIRNRKFGFEFSCFGFAFLSLISEFLTGKNNRAGEPHDCFS